MSHLDHEIHAQPAVLQGLLRREWGAVQRLAGEVHQRKPRAVFVVARGSSDNAALYAKYLLGARNRMLVALAAPSLFTLYGRPPDVNGCLVLALSQSGASDDLCQVVEQSRQQGAWALAITNRPRSPLARVANRVLCLHAGAERSVAATKTYTAELLALAMLSVALRGGSAQFQALERIPGYAQGALERSDDVARAAERYRYVERLAVIGRGFNYATAFELALKLKELAYVTAEPASSADFRHGPIAMVGEGFPVLLLAPRGKTLGDMRSLAAELGARKAELLAISNSRSVLSLARSAFRLPADLPEWLSPIASVIPGQLLARHLAAVRGLPLDRPRGLSKVTRTR
jgi:glucosamine--fructose-6-phosphate aminotransferase (isomerizing)